MSVDTIEVNNTNSLRQASLFDEKLPNFSTGVINPPKDYEMQSALLYSAFSNAFTIHVNAINHLTSEQKGEVCSTFANCLHVLQTAAAKRFQGEPILSNAIDEKLFNDTKEDIYKFDLAAYEKAYKTFDSLDQESKNVIVLALGTLISLQNGHELRLREDSINTKTVNPDKSKTYEAIRQLKESGYSLQEACELLTKTDINITSTQHPTDDSNTPNRMSRDKVFTCLEQASNREKAFDALNNHFETAHVVDDDVVDNPLLRSACKEALNAHDKLEQELVTFLKLPFSGTEKPTLTQEISHTSEYIGHFIDGVPGHIDTMIYALKDLYAVEIKEGALLDEDKLRSELVKTLTFTTWFDLDGNPVPTADDLVTAHEKFRIKTVESYTRYFQEICTKTIGLQISVEDIVDVGGQAMHVSLLPELKGRVRPDDLKEPYFASFLDHIGEKIKKAATDYSYTAKDLVDDLTLVQSILRGNSRNVAVHPTLEKEVADLIARVECCGFFGAKIDIREAAEVLNTVAEGKFDPDFDKVAARTQLVFEKLGELYEKDSSAFNRVIISGFSGRKDFLACEKLLSERNIDQLPICPLFETEETNSRKEHVLEELTSDDTYKKHVSKTGRVSFMYGLSDAALSSSNFMAQLHLHELVPLLHKTFRDKFPGITPEIFIGGNKNRGMVTSKETISAINLEELDKTAPVKFSLTYQGGERAFRIGNGELCQYSIGQILSGLVSARLGTGQITNDQKPAHHRRATPDELGLLKSFYSKGAELLQKMLHKDENRFSDFGNQTLPTVLIAMFNPNGSRPSSRNKIMANKLRAIVYGVICKCGGFNMLQTVGFTDDVYKDQNAVEKLQPIYHETLLGRRLFKDHPFSTNPAMTALYEQETKNDNYYSKFFKECSNNLERLFRRIKTKDTDKTVGSYNAVFDHRQEIVALHRSPLENFASIIVLSARNELQNHLNNGVQPHQLDSTLQGYFNLVTRLAYAGNGLP